MIYLILFTTIIILFWIKLIKDNQKRLCFPPGPLNLPIVGSLLYLTKDKLQHSFDGFYKKYGPIVGLKLGSVYTVVLNEYSLIHETFVKNPDIFSDRFALPTFNIVSQDRDLMFTNGAYWKNIRTIVSSSLTKSKIKKLESNIKINLNNLINEFENIIKVNDSLNVRDYYQRLSFNIIFNFLFSERVEFNDDSIPENIKIFLKSSRNLVELFSTGNLADFFPILKVFPNSGMAKIQTNVDNIINFSKPYVQEHIDTIDYEKPRDFMDVLLSEIKNHPEKMISSDAIPNICINILVAGTDTTSTALEWITLYLSNYPEIQDKLYNELCQSDDDDPTISDKNKYPFLLATIKESLRLSPPAQMGLPHACNEDFMLQNYFIPKGTQIITNLWSLGRNEQIFKNPHEFNPLRFYNNNDDVYSSTFSTGRRKCVGEPLAQNELFLICSKLFKKFKFERITNELYSEEGITAVTLVPELYKYRVVHR